MSREEPIKRRDIVIYCPDTFRETYDAMKEDIKHLWFEKHGESLTANDIIFKSMAYFKEYLQDNKENTNDNKRQNLHKYSRIKK